MKWRLCLFLLVFLIPEPTIASSSAPAEVEPVIYRGVKFTAEHESPTIGYVTAYDAKTGNKVWHKNVYEVTINNRIEEDVQWIFITRLSINQEGKLKVTTERGAVYLLDIPKEILTESIRYSQTNSYNQVPLHPQGEVLFLDDFNSGYSSDNSRWVYKNREGKFVPGIEGNKHTSKLTGEVVDGYLCFSQAGFVDLDLSSDRIRVPAGLDKLVIEYDTSFGGERGQFNYFRG